MKSGALPKANLVYWYNHKDMPRDGGGLRALAWHAALTELGFDVEIYPLRTVGAGTGEISITRRVKKSLIPMPLREGLPRMRQASVNVITVPSVFAAAAKGLDPATLVFDWMDLWSVNARTMARSSSVMLPGGVAQSMWWLGQELIMPKRAAVNTFAGYKDFSDVAKRSNVPSAWLPTPINRPVISRDSYANRHETVGFLANMNYPPNAMSIRRFLTTHAKSFESSKRRLKVAGYGSEVVKAWSNNIEVMGPLKNVDEFYGAVDAVIVPIDHGGGIKVKAVEAMMFGVPVYGTDHVKFGFSPEFWPYIGDLSAFMTSGTDLVTTPPAEVLDSHFSPTSFRSSIASLFTQAALLPN